MKKLFRILKRLVLITLALCAIFSLATCAFMQQPQFGSLPKGERLERVKKSPRYSDGKFHNLIERPTITEGYSIVGESWKTLFGNLPRRTPVDSLPSVRTNLKAIPAGQNVMVWFGHSSVFIQAGGVTFLADPIFSGKATPLPWGVKAYKGSDVYTADDMPEIDYLLISHDHYDHLDYETVTALKNKVKHVVCGLGVGAHFQRWGYKPEQIIERDWYQKVPVNDSVAIYTESSHHQSGRGFVQNKALWMSYLIKTPANKIYISGDGGFDGRFANIGKKFDGVDWAVMENGQYDMAWHAVHNLPEEVIAATMGLRAKNLLPVHHSKFTLAKHPWDEPLNKVTELSAGKPYRLATPMIGEVVRMDDSIQVFKQWWKGLE